VTKRFLAVARLSLLAAAVALALTACTSPGATDNASVDLGQSSRFSQADRQAAVDVTLTWFKATMKGCDLTGLRYSDADQSVYSVTSSQGVPDGNSIVLVADFHVDASGGDGSLNPNSDYTWQVYLGRADASSPWTVKDWGSG